MDVCFVTEGALNSVWQTNLENISDSDVVVFGFNGLGLVSYKKELSGETEYFQDVARLSKQIDGVVISGCDTDTYGVFRHSAVISDRGKILGVSDMIHSLDDSEFTAGSGLRVYDTSVGKIGIIVSEDLYFPEVSRVLSLCDAEFIVCVMKRQEDVSQIMLRANAFSNGVAMALCAENYSLVSDVKGRIIGGGANYLKVKVKKEKDYRLISSRRRGMYREFNSGY